MRLESFIKNPEKTFLHQFGRSWTYEQLLSAMTEVPRIGTTPVVLEAENNFQTFSRFLGLLAGGGAVHLVPAFEFYDENYRRLLRQECGTDFLYWPVSEDRIIGDTPLTSRHRLLENVQSDFGSFIVRTSGSSGKKFKFVLHEGSKFLTKFLARGIHFNKTFAFSPAGSIAGIETLLEAVIHQRELVSGSARPSPTEIAALIDRYQIDYFQTTPSFMNLLSASGILGGTELKGLKKIAYGSEPSQRTVLKQFREFLPDLEFMHTYGMSEIGIQKTLTNPINPSQFCLDRSFNDFRIHQGKLEVKSQTLMSGYLNVDDSLMEEGWFQTGDIVKEEKGFFSVSGRDSDLINLAGHKFFPSDVEDLIMNMDEVLDVTIRAESNDLIGSILIAEIVPAPQIDEPTFRRAFKDFAQRHIPYFMYPQKIILLQQFEPDQRFKKIRIR